MQLALNSTLGVIRMDTPVASELVQGFRSRATHVAAVALETATGTLSPRCTSNYSKSPVADAEAAAHHTNLRRLFLAIGTSQPLLA